MFNRITMTPLAQASRRASGGFLPTDLSGLIPWFDMSDISTLFQDDARTTPVVNDGDVIGGVTDKSGNGVHATQATTSKKVLYKTGIQNGLSAAQGDGIDDFLQFDVQNVTEFTYFGVWAYQASNDTPHGGGIGVNILYKSSVTLAIFNTSGSFIFVTTPNHAYNEVVSYSATWLGQNDSYILHQNGATADSDNVADASINFGTLFCRTATTNFFLGNLMEFGLYDNAKSNDDRLLLEAYINEKWAIY